MLRVQSVNVLKPRCELRILLAKKTVLTNEICGIDVIMIRKQTYLKINADTFGYFQWSLNVNFVERKLFTTVDQSRIAIGRYK